MPLEIALGPKLTPKMLGDAGEHFALSQFMFAGNPATKMPDLWPEYDLTVKTSAGLVRVSVKTRSESAGWKTSKWFTINENDDCDWVVFVFQPKVPGRIKSWALPVDIVMKHASVPGPDRKNAHLRDVSWSKLNREPLSFYENNWVLKRGP